MAADAAGDTADGRLGLITTLHSSNLRLQLQARMPFSADALLQKARRDLLGLLEGVSYDISIVIVHN